MKEDFKYLMEKALEEGTSAEEARKYRKQALLLLEAEVLGEKTAGIITEEEYEIKARFIENLREQSKMLYEIGSEFEQKRRTNESED